MRVSVLGCERILVREPPKSCDVTNEREQSNTSLMKMMTCNAISLVHRTQCLSFAVMITEKIIFAPHHQKYYPCWNVPDEDREML